MRHFLHPTPLQLARALDRLAALVYRRRVPLEPLRFTRLSGPPFGSPPAPAAGDPGEPIPPGTYWGGPNVNFLLRGVVTIPADIDPAAGPLALHLPLGEAGDFSHPEALVYLNGVPWAGVDRHHQEIPLPCSAGWHPASSAPGSAIPSDATTHRRDTTPRYNLLLHGWTGLLGSHDADPARRLFMGQCALVQIDPPARDLLTLGRAALQTAELLDERDPARARLLTALDDALRLLHPSSPSSSVAILPALDALRAGVAAAGPPLDLDLIAAGHAHIDVAWLWTLGQTRGKAARTFATVLRLMEQFPDFHFTQSQPQLYDFLRADQPALFDQVAARVAEGRWEPIGGMWVEADCNISGPESLARQLVLGRRFFRDRFGPAAESPVLWLPDVFGYAWNLPQLIREAGLEYFFTIKIGWNQTNQMPFDSFWWQGLDGTRVLTHFSTAPEGPGDAGGGGTGGFQTRPYNLRATATYNANLTPFAALGSWVKLKHKATQRTMLMAYGYGDGGGGPTREMNETAGALRHFPGLPRVTQGRVIDFFRQLEAESGGELPVWNSELYLEIHRGTYTTQSRNKRANRRSEFLLHDAEFLAALATTLDPAYAYPHEMLRRAWELVCLNQFHDIIPGSSIGAVYEESLRQYADVAALAQSVRDEALAVVARVGNPPLLINPTSFPRDDYAFLPIDPDVARSFLTAAGPATLQPVDGGLLLDAGTLPPYSVTPLQMIESASSDAGFASTPSVSEDADTEYRSKSPLLPRTPAPLRFTPHTLENAYLLIEFNPAGDITRIYDKTHRREALPPGAIANQWQAFDDHPLNWDAWDIDSFYEDTRYLAEPAASVRVVEEGPLRATLEIRRRILHSATIQRISLCANRPQIDFDTWIDWRERHILLKTAFPLDVLAPVATHEIQWGNVQRPTHRNTSWDWARFETCAQKWVDLSEGDYGAALLNDCKYGHDVRDNVIRLTLLRAPTAPDPEADQGEHRFAYSLFFHGPARPAEIAARAYALNDPLLVVAGGAAGEQGSGDAGEQEPSAGASFTPAPLPPSTPALLPPAPPLPRVPALPLSLISVDPPHLIIETVKAADDGDGLIVRLYECERRRGPAVLRTAFPLRAAWRTNLLEENRAPLDVAGREARLTVRPFEIVTVRLCL
ncbi:glycoside hydrolase family 38 C-terminal domain-containing protein [Promineifilum sp.]|uniref:glycoside hydrolase family 38 N-terminal domain-containing protein n=1 Tax=Promineifilum sp. TaxID=2664178 RepID=UPI0035B07EF1